MELESGVEMTVVLLLSREEDRFSLEVPVGVEIAEVWLRVLGETKEVVMAVLESLAVVAGRGVGGEPAVVVGPWQWLTLQHSTRIM